jgi:hypothetical protein
VTSPAATAPDTVPNLTSCVSGALIGFWRMSRREVVSNWPVPDLRNKTYISRPIEPPHHKHRPVKRREPNGGEGSRCRQPRSFLGVDR